MKRPAYTGNSRNCCQSLSASVKRMHHGGGTPRQTSVAPKKKRSYCHFAETRCQTDLHIVRVKAVYPRPVNLSTKKGHLLMVQDQLEQGTHVVWRVLRHGLELLDHNKPRKASPGPISCDSFG